MSSSDSGSDSQTSMKLMDQYDDATPLDLSIPKLTPNNGFARGLEVKKIVASCIHGGERLFAVKFKGCRKPEVVSNEEVKAKATKQLIEYYLQHAVVN